MGMKEIQKEVNKWARQYKKPYWPIKDQMLRLQEEIGELSREINHLYGSKKKKSTESKRNLGDELSDVIFTICCMANSKGINLQEEWDRMMKEKLYGRDNERYRKR
jgi:NTP pyrophosphatase (non-canonical NTP hydrolase)